jgi:uncharacterized protein YndB with AHSA1/START domain
MEDPMRVSTARDIAAPPDAVFELVSNPRELPSWNQAVQRTVVLPEQMTPGAQWVIEMRALGQTWQSRSVVLELDREQRRFRYRSGTDDGNPSYAEWTWSVTPSASGCRVTVCADLNPATFWRRVLLVHVRARALRRREIPSSLVALEAAAIPVGS